MLTYVSLFSSAGVGCFGLKELGFKCIATAELLEKRLNIQKYNNKCEYDSGYICGDLTRKDTHDRLYGEINAYKKRKKLKGIDLVVATPPCQGMSVANHKKNEELGRNSLVVESLKIVKDQQPRFFIFENVRAFLKSVCTDLDGVDKPIKEAIHTNLGPGYQIESKVLNLKNYGANSSRTRTLVIGVRRDQKGVTPLDLYPDFRPEKTLQDVIGHLPSLKEMGEFSEDDFFHSFRPYKEEMLPWIKATPYGKSAFDNTDNKLKPHKVVDGQIVVNQSKNGDKYQRQLWDKVAPCIHTRNDCLPSQNTVHPVDDRVFSIRELMLMMSIPESFQWFPSDTVPANTANYEVKNQFRKMTDITIRQCLGEAVPSAVFGEIGRKIMGMTPARLSKKQIADTISEYHLEDMATLYQFVEQNWQDYAPQDMFKICELANAERLDTAAYYTDQEICFSAVTPLPEISSENVRVLEPSVGVGNFLHQIVKKYQGKKLIIDCVDINKDSIELCKLLISKYISLDNVEINFFNEDFLLLETNKIYDVVVGNPPYMKIKDNNLLSKYRRGLANQTTNNIFSFFIEKCSKLGKHVSLIVPKALLNAPEYMKTRKLLETHTLLHINDYNEKAFDVKIETISVTYTTSKPKKHSQVSIYSYLNEVYFVLEQDYLTHNDFNSWLLYRNEWFDEIFQTLEFGKFKVFRDRQITKIHTKEQGKYRVIKSRNIGHGCIKDIENYDCYVDDISEFAVKKYLDANVILVPNLTYNPRATRLPKGCVADGSAAILYTDDVITDYDIDYFSSQEFNTFYRIARNYGTRSMNIDSVSVNYFGVKR
ncbi:restriction endonuclease [Pseudoalteromonas sp. BMB]|uniref:DNA cytosine methyltransferase n=1 Tax=Pseudoalteromonas sp. BMB TaxID=1874619 RepID=UPI00083CE249|nr:DNA cytosine methyltransferase [Pseudoalteromonas sp. BMB]ODB36213.1 restriction endonuclease [Pseudoalteromonas sp. BMB]